MDPNWSREEREVFSLALLHTCATKGDEGEGGRKPNVTLVLGKSFDVFSDAIRRVSMHVAEKGIIARKPIPRTVYACIPVVVGFRSHLQDIQAARDLNTKLHDDFRMARRRMQRSSSAWHYELPEDDNNDEEEDETNLKERAAHEVCEAAIWSATLMPRPYSTRASSLVEVKEDEVSKSGETAHLIRMLETWEAGKSDICLDYQIVVECNLAWAFPSTPRRRRTPRRKHTLLPTMSGFEKQQRPASEHMEIPAQRLWDIIRRHKDVEEEEYEEYEEDEEVHSVERAAGEKETKKKAPSSSSSRPLKDSTNSAMHKAQQPFKKRAE